MALRLGVALIASAIRLRWTTIVARHLGLRVLGLHPPFQQVGQQHGHVVGEFAFFAFPHVIDLVGEVFDIELGEPSGAQQARLLLRPEDHVPL